MDKKPQLPPKGFDYVRRERDYRNLAEIDSTELSSMRIALNTDIAKLKDEKEYILSRISSISKELKRRNNPGPDVDISEHAVLRYLERVNNINVKKIREKIRAAIPCNVVRGDIFEVDGISYIISNEGRVVTLYKKDKD